MKNSDKFIKIFTGTYAIITITVLLREVLYSRISFNNIYSIAVVLNLMIITLVMAIVFIKPKWKIFLFFLFIFESLPTFTSDDISFAMFLYYFALMLGLSFGVFKKKSKKRLFISIIPLIFIYIYLYITSPFSQFTATVIVSVVETSMIVFLLLLFKQHIEDLLPVKIDFDLKEGLLKKSEKILDLKALGFTFEDAYLINEILKGNLYKEIASKSNYSESSIKRKASIIFEKFSCNSRKEFENNAKQFDIVFGDDDVYKRVNDSKS